MISILRQHFPRALFLIILLQTETKRKRLLPVVLSGTGQPLARVLKNRQIQCALCKNMFLPIPAFLLDCEHIIGAVQHRKQPCRYAQPKMHQKRTRHILVKQRGNDTPYLFRIRKPNSQLGKCMPKNLLIQTRISLIVTFPAAALAK